MKSQHQFLNYIGIGVLSALLDVGVAMLLVFGGVRSILALTVGFFLGFSFNFALHARITFKSGYAHYILIKYIFVVFVNYAVTITISRSFELWFDSLLIGKMVSLPLVAFNGFLLGKYWIFKR